MSMQTFHFKQFFINHANSAHKVGTDGVLLGAWTNIDFGPNSILDIGTGTGLVALIMAQRSFAETIEAIELDADAYEECVGNFEHSIWNDRLFCFHGDVKEFAEEPDLKYDLIACNPPFFDKEETKSPSIRDHARKQVSLTYEELLTSVQLLLSVGGEFSTVIPYSDFEKFVKIAKDYSLFPNRVTNVKGHVDSDYKRCLIQFGFQPKTPILNELVLENSRHNYTEDYRSLVKDLYLKL